MEAESLPAPSAESLLSGTPYLVASDATSQKRFGRVLERSVELGSRARAVGARIQTEASDVFASFGLTLRSEAVAESNRMEDFDWTPQQVREVILANRELLDAPVHTFLEAVRADSRTYEALGLYRAQLLAEEWSRSEERPREIEMRQLHGLITAGAHYAGRYKTAPNNIGGATHIPPAPADAAEGMTVLANWWREGTGDPLLDATVVHAWLVHLHPFEDGNGRMARLLGNVALSQDEYPPLIISAESDRGEYYAALAASDDGDLLPLFDLFGRVLRRSTKLMSSPDYVERVLRDRMLTSPSRQRALWHAQAQALTRALKSELRSRAWDGHVQGYPSDLSFDELAVLNPDGNSWYFRVADQQGRQGWLLWFGFNSVGYQDSYGEPSGYPSIFLSTRNEDPEALHPYSPVRDVGLDDVWSELVLVPGVARPARLHRASDWEELTIQDAARLMVDDVTR